MLLNSAMIAGVDEVGRGPLAGPVMACAVILSEDRDWTHLKDSKVLNAMRREQLCAEIHSACAVGIAEATVAEIEEFNILGATFLAMQRAVKALPVRPRRVLVDGDRTPPNMGYPCEAIVKGDTFVPSIAAASIVAKVTRDRLLAKMSVEFPQYGWDRNAGYGTPEHMESLRKFGPTPHHRPSFIAKLLENRIAA